MNAYGYTDADMLPLTLTTRTIPGASRVEMCGIPLHRLEQYVEQLRDKYDVTISGIEQQSGERGIYTLRSFDHTAEQAIDAHEAKFGADGERAFPNNVPEAETQ